MNHQKTIEILNTFPHETKVEFLITNLSSNQFDQGAFSFLTSIKNLNVGQAILNLIENGCEEGDGYSIKVAISNYLELKLTKDIVPLVRKHKNPKDLDAAIACAKVNAALGYFGDSIETLLTHDEGCYKTPDQVFACAIISFASLFCNKSDENALIIDADVILKSITSLLNHSKEGIDAVLMHEVIQFISISIWHYNSVQRIIIQSKKANLDISSLLIDNEDLLSSLATVTKLVRELPKDCFEGTLAEQKEEIHKKITQAKAMRMSLNSLSNFLNSTNENKIFH